MGGAIRSAVPGGTVSPGACAGFVLTGGESSRMGRDKALLACEGKTLVERIAERVRRAAGHVTLIGASARYLHLGLPVEDDRIPGCGPLGGLHTALTISNSDWNLVVACDMPAVTAAFLGELIGAARASGADCVVPEGRPGTAAAGLHPLCAVYHRRCLAAVESAVAHKSLKMHDVIDSLRVLRWPLSDPGLVENVNTPAGWSAL